MIRPRVSAGSRYLAQAIRNALVRRYISIVAKDRVAMGMMMGGQVAVVMVAEQNVRQMVVGGLFLETQLIVWVRKVDLIAEVYLPQPEGPIKAITLRGMMSILILDKARFSP